MQNEQNPYASPKASLQTDPQSEPSAVTGPTGFVETLREMFKLYPKTASRLAAYLLLIWLLYTMVVVGPSFFIGGMGMVTDGLGSAEAGGIAIIGTIVVTIFLAISVLAFGAALCFKHIDNKYTGRSTSGEFSEAIGLIPAVIGALFLKGILVAICQGGLTFAGAEINPLLLLPVGLLLLGLYVYIHFVELGVIVDGYGVIDALRHAVNIVKGNWFFAVGLAVVVFVIYFCAVLGLAGVMTLMQESGESIGFMVVMTIVFGVLALLAVSFLMVANYMVYRALTARQRKQRGW